MRQLHYLSPTSMGKFIESQDNFYIEYLADIRPPRQPQTRPMSIGSAFDAYAKSYLFDKLCGKSDPNSNKFEFDTLFTNQVEPQNRDWARDHGKYVFDKYVQVGALADFFVELEKSIGKPKFEMDIQGTVSHDLHGVPFLGKPDVFYVNMEACNIITDWKVNGYCSRTGASPMKEYIRLFPGLNKHKDAYPIKHRGMLINGSGSNLHEIDESWARQTVIYGWLCGCPVGSDFIHAIDQVACNNRYNPNPGEGRPELRFAQHRYKSHVEFQFKVFREAVKIWQLINAGQEGYFEGLSPEDSKSRCEALERQAKSMFQPQTEFDRQFAYVLED